MRTSTTHDRQVPSTVGDRSFGVGQTGGVDVEGSDRCARLREHAAHRRSDPTAARARDDDRAAVESEPIRDHVYIVTMRRMIPNEYEQFEQVVSLGVVNFTPVWPVEPQ